MSPYLKIVLWGFAISALGSLPLGTLNVAALQVSMEEGVLQGIYFSIGAALVEVAYVRLSLSGIQWMQSKEALLKWLDWLSLAIIIVLAVGSFWAAIHPTASKSFVLQTSLPYFILGLLMSALNPVQIPFWFGWSAILYGKGVLKPQKKYYKFYILGIGLGTLSGLAVFVYGGPLLLVGLKAGKSVVNYTIGGVFLFTAILQGIRLVRGKGLAVALKKGLQLPAEE